jgi:uncharacterized protein YwqG
MTNDQIIAKLEPWLTKHRRPAWTPVVEDGDGPPTASKFCGSPWIGPDAPWPDCGNCKKPLQLFLQLDLEDLPEEIGQRFGTGLLQLFYCTRTKCQGHGGWEPFADDLSRVRVVQFRGASIVTSVPKQDVHFPAKRIIRWERFLDLPHFEEQAELGVKYVYDHEARTVRLECQELDFVVDNIDDAMLGDNIKSQPGDKLAGWPAWVQGAEYPNCPRCGRRMVHVFQVDSEINIPFMFGDCGCGHITQCPHHKDVVAFGWACC